MTAWSAPWPWPAAWKSFIRKAGRRNEFMSDMAQLAEKSKPSITFFEYLAELYNSANRETEYAQILSRLFDLYFEAGNYAKALDALDRAVDIDPYEAEHKERMQKLAGHAPEDRLQAVAKRLGSGSARAGYGHIGGRRLVGTAPRRASWRT